MTILFIFFSLSVSAHQGFQSLSCSKEGSKFSTQKIENSYQFQISPGLDGVKDPLMKDLKISDFVDKKSGQVIDVYKGSIGNWQFEARRPETKGPQKNLTVHLRHSKSSETRSWQNCQIKF